MAASKPPPPPASQPGPAHFTPTHSAHTAPYHAPFSATPPQQGTPERERSMSSSAHSTPQHARPYQYGAGMMEPSPTPPSTPGSTPSHMPARSNTLTDRSTPARRDQGQQEVILRSRTEVKQSPDHKRPAGVM